MSRFLGWFCGSMVLANETMPRGAVVAVDTHPLCAMACYAQCKSFEEAMMKAQTLALTRACEHSARDFILNVRREDWEQFEKEVGGKT